MDGEWMNEIERRASERVLVLARQSSRSREERALACSLVRSNGRTEEELSLLLDLIGRKNELAATCLLLNQSNREEGESVHSLVRSITEGRARLFLVGRSCRHHLMSIVTWFVLCPFDWKNELARSL